MTPEEKARQYAEQYYSIPVHQQIAEAAHLAGQQAALEWIPVTPETMPEEKKHLQLFYKNGIKYGVFTEHHNFFILGDNCYSPLLSFTHFRYIPQDKPGEK